ncbi:MAG: hypothetical protein EON51_17115 [Acinetobacter sp.]|nr:MAG: hypothetical protein EON51_17115 [Acinetobacter sp.]
MKNLALIMLTSCLFALALSCRKLNPYNPNPAPVLPPISAEGRNTFGFMFGNEVWAPNFYSASAILYASYSSMNGGPRLSIVCLRKSTRNAKGVDDFTLQYFSSSIGLGTYPLNSSTCKAMAYILLPDNKEREYQLEDVGTITFSRWDIVNKIVSGTFSMTLKDALSGEKVTVTQGRFDVKFSE